MPVCPGAMDPSAAGPDVHADMHVAVGPLAVLRMHAPRTMPLEGQKLKHDDVLLSVHKTCCVLARDPDLQALPLALSCVLLQRFPDHRGTGGLRPRCVCVCMCFGWIIGGKSGIESSEDLFDSHVMSHWGSPCCRFGSEQNKERCIVVVFLRMLCRPVGQLIGGSFACAILVS